MIDFYNDQRIKFIDFNAYQLIFLVVLRLTVNLIWTLLSY